MNRRDFLSMLGLAPIAAAVVPLANAIASPSAVVGIDGGVMPFSINAQEMQFIADRRFHEIARIFRVPHRMIRELRYSGSADRWPASTDPVRGAGLVRPSGSRPDCPVPSIA